MLSLLQGFKPYIVVIGMLLTACSNLGPVRLYAGAKQPDSQVVKFIFPAAVDALEIDGEKFTDSSGITEGQYELDLLPGEHSFKVIYSQNWGSEALGSLVESKAFYFTLNTAAGNVYHFEHNGPKDLVYAEFGHSIDDIKIWLIASKTGNKIEAVNVQTYGYIISRYLFGSVGTGSEAKKPAEKEKINQSQQKELNNVQQKASEQLEFWWKIANAEQRKVFQDWLVTQKELKTNKTMNTMQQKATTQLKFWWKLADMEQRQSFLLWVKK